MADKNTYHGSSRHPDGSAVAEGYWFKLYEREWIPAFGDSFIEFRQRDAAKQWYKDNFKEEDDD